MKKYFLFLIILFLTGNSRSQWVQLFNYAGNQKVKSLASSGNYVFCGSNLGLDASSNYGNNWYYPGGLPNGTVWALGFKGNDLFAGVESNGVYLSSNYGASWTSASNGLGPVTVFSIASGSTAVYAGLWLGGIFMSSNEGSSWNSISNGYLDGKTVESILVNNNYLYAATYEIGIWRSSNNGANWTSVNNGIQNTSSVFAIVPLGNKIFIGTGTGVYYTTNNGDNWVMDDIGIPPAQILKLTVSGNYVLAGGGGGVGVYLSTNAGGNWYSFYDGLPMVQYTYIYALGSNNVFFFAGPQFTTDGFGLWRRPISDITAVNNTGTEIPDRFTLYQNYPNPFNPATKISYDLPANVNLKLVVYDILGREVKTLVNEKQNSGKHEMEFDASNYPSGVYYYKLSTDNFSETKKMVLIK